jgi:ribosomal protein S18 acetylase RimI-like enzyme
MSIAIRPVAATDLPALRAVIAATDLFPPEMLDGMLAAHGRGEADEIWLAGGTEPAPAGLLYAAPERMTEGTWNLLLIAVHPARQGRGLGSALVRHLEALLAARGARILLVETSGLPGFEATRGFYRRRGFAEEARIRDYYCDGEDKVVFRKALPAA